MLTQLPKRMAFVRSGDETAVIQTFDSSPEVEPEELQQRLYLIQEQTKQKFCRPRTEVEQADKDEPPDEPFSRSEVI